MTNEEPRAATTLEALSDDLANVVAATSRAVVAVNARHTVPSSGTVWRPGVVVTAAHGIKRDDDITVTAPDGRALPATLAGRDAGTDLAVLTVTGELETATTGAADVLRVGSLALAVGRSADGSPAATLGVVGALGGAWRTWRGGHVDRYVRLDVALTPGFSGGAVTSASGTVVGIATAGLSRGFGLAIPTATVERVADELLSSGRVARGFLGVGMQPVRLPDALVAAHALGGEAGVIVLGVEPDGPAARGGLLIGDVVVALDGKRVEDTDDVQAALSGDRIGTELRVRVVRAGALAELGVTVGEWPRGRGR